MMFAFSRPPMRCSRPFVPGIAHGRASVSASRAYGWNVSPLSCANSTSIFGSDAMSGTSHGSAPFARYASLSRTPGCGTRRDARCSIAA